MSKHPLFIIDKFYLDYPLEVRQSGQMLISFIFAFEENSHVIFANKGILNLIDYHLLFENRVLRDSVPEEIYSYTWLNYIDTNLHSEEKQVKLFTKIKPLYQQWSLFVNEYEFDRPITLLVTEDSCDGEVLIKVLELIKSGAIPLIGDLTYDYQIIKTLGMQKLKDDHLWVM